MHTFQGLIYVAVIVLALKASPWGYGAGVVIATFWNSLSLFVTHLIQAGAGQLVSLLRTGHVDRPDTLMVMIGGVGHFLLIIGCLAAFLRQRPNGRKWAEFFGGAVLCLAYFTLIVRLFLPGAFGRH
ncbi:MAG: hypothetical protein JO185_12760 [Acidobacteriaceae bacterium]|nr:hypothetical protein [Acidobacteriaceae bacterium]